ncbi:MAG: hypothetical protein Q9162_004599 [Coniocarpon cinnabarinum]
MIPPFNGYSYPSHLSHSSQVNHTVQFPSLTPTTAFAANLLLPTYSVTLTASENLSVYKDLDTTSGNPVYRYFCKTCGNPIKSEVEAATKAGKVILKLGIFGEGGLPVPEHECFVKSKQAWVRPLEGTKRWDMMIGGTPAKDVGGGGG